MTSEETRKLIEDFYAALASGDRARLATLIADDVEWRMPDSVEDNIVSGREAVMGELGSATVKRLFQKGSFELKIHAIHADGPTGIVQTSTKAITKAGKPYANEYVWVYSCRDGMIHYIREYLDTAASFRMLDWKLD